MSPSPKLHGKLDNSKHAAVSLDSLLGVLASAYGTKELDSKSVFDTNTLNWRHISVENFKSQITKESLDEATKATKYKCTNNRELGKTSVCTSTTNLKLLRSLDSKTDVTLASIRSLEDINNKSKLENTSDDQSKHSQASKHKSLENDTKCTDEIDKCENLNNVDEKCTICGFFVDGPEQEVLFDIQFFKIVRTPSCFPIFDTSEQDIQIQVTDLVTQTKSTIDLSKRYIPKSSYFAEVDKEYGLENLEICLKCNSKHFYWVVEWIKADISMCKPNLCHKNLKGILLIAYHLKINHLVEECLEYLSANLKPVLELNSDIEHLFVENLSMQFVTKTCNTDISRISDEHESFTMKMFCALIRLLADDNVCGTAGHHWSLAPIFQCVNCDKLLNYSVMHLVPCLPRHTQLNRKGEVQYLHKSLPSWNLSKYIELLFQEFQNWKLVYWYLWGMCHFLYCTHCQALYPVSQSEWCPYHPNEVEYFPMNSDLYYPIGSYTCCGEKAFKFNTLNQCSGCQFKNHTPDLSTSKDMDIFKIYEMNKSYISCKAPEVGQKTFLKLVNKTEDKILSEKVIERFWWNEVQLAPKEKKDYSIIPVDIFNQLRGKPLQRKASENYEPLSFRPQVHFGMVPSCQEIVEDSSTERLYSVECKKNKSKLTTVPSTKSKIKYKSFLNHENTIWSSSLSNRDNQENQRDFEEVAMKRIVKMLTPTLPDFNPEPMVGTYVRLEADWWRDHCAASKTTGKISGTVVNRTFPLSWFRRPV